VTCRTARSQAPWLARWGSIYLPGATRLRLKLFDCLDDMLPYDIQAADTIYYEVLDIPPRELERLKMWAGPGRSGLAWCPAQGWLWGQLVFARLTDAAAAGRRFPHVTCYWVGEREVPLL
jgi:hypothetical protein